MSNDPQNTGVEQCLLTLKQNGYFPERWDAPFDYGLLAQQRVHATTEHPGLGSVAIARLPRGYYGRRAELAITPGEREQMIFVATRGGRTFACSERHPAYDLFAQRLGDTAAGKPQLQPAGTQVIGGVHPR